jgi:hypothetical protein
MVLSYRHAFHAGNFADVVKVGTRGQRTAARIAIALMHPHSDGCAHVHWFAEFARG